MMKVQHNAEDTTQRWRTFLKFKNVAVEEAHVAQEGTTFASGRF